MTEAVLLVGVYLVIDEIIQRREARRWSDLSSLGLRALSAFARGPADVVRRGVDELAVETGRAPPENYQELIAARADELGDWLRADDARARTFAEELRRASG